MLCTDGVLEATNEAREQFGFERLEGSLAAGCSRPRDVADWLQRDLREHVVEAPQYDDVTLIVLGVTAEATSGRVRRRDEPTQTLRKP